MSDELKKCPFCGHDAVIYTVEDTEIASCAYCGSSGEHAMDRESAVENWNTRPLEDALQKRIDELEEDLTFMALDLHNANNTIDELESENKALRLIAGSHSMSELRRNRIMAGDKWFKYPPAPEKGNDNV